MDMDLQYFADEGSAAPETGAPEGEEQQTQPNEEQTAEKTFTQDEVDDMVQKRLARALKGKEQEIENAKAEAVKYAKMNKDEKMQHDLEKSQAEAKEAQDKLARYEMRDEVRSQLSDNGFKATDDDLNLIIADSAEATKQNTQSFLAMVERIRESVRNELLKGNTPKAGGQKVKTPSVQQFRQMDYAARVELKAKNPDLYNELVGKSY